MIGAAYSHGRGVKYRYTPISETGLRLTRVDGGGEKKVVDS